MLWRIFERASILVGCWFGMVWTGWSSIFSKHPFHSYSIHPFLKNSILVKSNKEFDQFRPQNNSCLYPFSMLTTLSQNNTIPRNLKLKGVATAESLASSSKCLTSCFISKTHPFRDCGALFLLHSGTLLLCHCHTLGLAHWEGYKHHLVLWKLL